MPEKNKGKRLKIGAVILILFSLLYLPSLYHWMSQDNVSSDILRMGTIEDSVSAEGLLVRDEVILNPTAAEGKVVPKVLEGERIPAFSCVATISNNAAISLLEDLDEVNAKIIQAQNERAKKNDFFSEDIAKINEDIGHKVQGIINLCNTNSMINLGQMTLEVDKLIEKKSAIAGGDDGDANIKALKQKKSEIEQRINSGNSQVISEYSGIISYVIDGYEQILTPKALNELTPEIIKSVKDINQQVPESYEDVNEGKPFIKVIKGNNTYIVAVLQPEKAKMFKAEESITLRMNGIESTIQAVVTDISEKSPGQFVMTVKIDRYSEELSSMRKINVDFIKKFYEGLKLPVKCLYSPDADWKKAKVMLIKANCATEREVEVLCRDEEYAIIRTPEDEVKKTVSLYDTYILNQDNIKEGQIILK